MSKLKEIIMESDAFVRAMTKPTGAGGTAKAVASIITPTGAASQVIPEDDARLDQTAREIIGQVFANVPKNIAPDKLAHKLLEAALSVCDPHDDAIYLSNQLVTFFEQLSLSARDIHQTFVLAEACVSDPAFADDHDLDDDEDDADQADDARNEVTVRQDTGRNLAAALANTKAP